MKRTVHILSAILIVSLLGNAQQKDNPDCKDYPLFTRMPNYWIHSCTQKEFFAHDFHIAQGKTENVEGQYWRINYYPQATLKTKPSDLQILRNFENAVAKLGGTTLFKEKGKETFRLNNAGKELWVEASAEFTGKYGLIIVEKHAMTQDIVANAEALTNDLNATGHSAVYGIFFDTGKSDLKPESGQALQEIAKLLKGNPVLKVYVVGHTDNVGGLEGNMKLSKDRANAVVDALVRTHGVVASRLSAFGNGPYAPVASNDTEEGRAKNRRVELVKQ